jgi:hypothetical protein
MDYDWQGLLIELGESARPSTLQNSKTASMLGRSVFLPCMIRIICKLLDIFEVRCGISVRILPSFIGWKLLDEFIPCF